MRLRTIREARLQKGTRVILRADFDVSLSRGRIVDDFRIRASLPTIRYLLARHAAIRIVAHLDRPKGRVVPALSLWPVAAELSRLLRRRVRFVRNPFDQDLYARYDTSREILFFENIRFFPGEEAESRIFARRLSRWGDCYVNDAFGDLHRPHASMVALARALPAYAGLRLEGELNALEKILKNPRRPRALILGGAKLETKLPLIARFLNAGDAVLVGGALANTLLLAEGFGVGRSERDLDLVEKLRRQRFARRNLYLPVDLRVARKPAATPRTVGIGEMRADEIIFDIGPRSVVHFGRALAGARTIVWNGPLGLVEVPRFAEGTAGMARLLRKARGFKVVGGGDLVAFLRKKGLLLGFDHVSTGGGAMLEFLVGRPLPGLKALEK